jgi:hypothetical protein
LCSNLQVFFCFCLVVLTFFCWSAHCLLFD